MIRLPIWRALVVPALAMSAPLYAAPLDRKSPDVWAAPHLFGTFALQVARTPYDAKWRLAGIGSRGSFSRAAAPVLRDLTRVQRDVNRRVSFRADSPGLGSGDAWSTAAITLARGSGDCEDYAIAKGQSLLALGFLPQSLYLVIGHDLTARSAHAVLVVRVGAKFWVLDNRSSQVVDADRFGDFSPIITLSANRKWVHGYKRGARPRLIIARARSLDLPTNRLSAVKVAQAATLTIRSPIL